MSSSASDVEASSATATAAAAAAAASPTKSDEFGELDFVVVDEVDNLTAGSPTTQADSCTVNAEVTVDANSNVTTPRVYHRREKKALALSLIDDIALQSGTPRKASGSVADKLNPGRGDAANSPASSASPPPSIAIPATSAAPVVSNPDAAVHSVGEDPESVPGPKNEVPNSAREEEQPAVGFPSEKKRRQGLKNSSKAGLVRKKAISEKTEMTSDQMLSICLPRYNWLEKKLHDVAKPVCQPGTQNETKSPTTVESSGDTAPRNSPIVLQNPTFNDSSKNHSEISDKNSHVTAKRPTSVVITAESRSQSDPCNSNITAKSSLGRRELIEVTDDEEPVCHWSECVIVDDEIASEESVASPRGDNEPILLPRIDTATPDLPFHHPPRNGGDEAGNKNTNEDIPSANNNSIIPGNDNTYTDDNKRVDPTDHNSTRQQAEEMEEKKQEDSQDDVVLLEVTPAKDADGFYSFHPFAYKPSRSADDNFIDLCSKRSEDFESPINLLNANDGDVTISQLKNNLSKTFDIASSDAAANKFDVDKLHAGKTREFTKHQRLLAAALDPVSGAFSLNRTDLDKQEPRINETCQLLYRKIQSIVKSKSPEMCGSKINLAETPHGNACRSLQDAINTAMVKAMSEDFEEDLQPQVKGKPISHLSGFGVSESLTSKQMPQRPASSGQTHLPPKKRSLCIDDTAGASNVSNRSPPLSKRRKTTSRIQKVRPILLTEGDDDKGSDEVTIVKPHDLPRMTPLDVAEDPASAWPGTSIQCRSTGPLTQPLAAHGLTPNLLKANSLPDVDIAIEREKLRVAKTSMLAPPKRELVKKKVGRRPSQSEAATPGMLPSVSSKGLFKFDSPPETSPADYFYGDNEDNRYVHLKDGTIAFKEMRAMQQPFSTPSGRYTPHVDLTGSRLSSSPAHHLATGVSQASNMALAFPKVGWPGHKAQGMDHTYYQAAMPSQSPIPQPGTYAGSSTTGFFECLTSRANLATTSRSWVPPKPKAVPEASISADSGAGLGHAFHPVTPSNKLLPYPQYQPSKNCAPALHPGAAEAHRSVIKPQPGALHHPMVPVPAPLRPGGQLPFGLGVSAGQSQAPPPGPLQAAYRAGWAPTSAPPSPRTPYSHPVASSPAHYDPRSAAHLMRRSAEAYSVVPGPMLASRFGNVASMYHQLPRHPLHRGHTPDAGQASAFWTAGAQHAIPSVPPFTKQ